MKPSQGLLSDMELLTKNFFAILDISTNSVQNSFFFQNNAKDRMAHFAVKNRRNNYKNRGPDTGDEL